MKIIKKFQIYLAALVLIFSVSCTEDFKDMNENPNAATTVPATNVLGQSLLTSTYILFGERLDIYYAGTWAGHTAAIGLGDYEYRVDINNGQWRSMYIAMTYATDAMRLAEQEENDNIYAAALTLRAYLVHKASDMWGSVPYSEAFQLEEDILYPKYDSQPELYDQIISELKTAADLFDENGKDIGAGDFLFYGNVEKWKKFCNSTRLRVAIRMSNVDETTATSVIQDVINNDYPLITSNDDNAYFWWPGVPPDQELWYERVGADDGNKTDQYRMNHYLIGPLKELNDPRLPVYADPNEYGEFNGYHFGPNQRSDTLNNGNNVSHIGDRFGNDPDGFSPFFNSAEVHFLLAEIYQRGLLTGEDARTHYEMGITRSLQENGIEESDITAYLAEDGVAWDSGERSNLDKIYLQKWISLFKQSVEAWAEARRTDVPLMPQVETNYSGDHNRPPFRMSYADEEESLNANFPSDINQEDIFWGTQLWWDTREGVY